jgi:hypothetical protein
MQSISAWTRRAGRDVLAGAALDILRVALQQTASAAGLSVAERGVLETGNAVADGVQRTLGQHPIRHVTIEDKFIQPNLA